MADSQDLLGGTAPEVEESNYFHLLKQALINEKAAPEILPYQAELISVVEQRIELQRQQVEAHNQPEDHLLQTLLQRDLQRVEYVLRSYLRTRLVKIEEYVSHVLDDDDTQALCSPKEVSHAKEYFVLWGSYLKQQCLNWLPEKYRSLVRTTAAAQEKDMVHRPELDTNVFVRVLEDKGSIVIDDDGDTVEFSKGDLYVVRYKFVRDLVREAWVELI